MPAFNRPRVRWATAGAAVLLLVGAVAALGGFADVPRERLPTYAVGDRFDNGLYSIRVRSVAVVDRDPLTGYELEAPQIAAEADLLLRGERASSGAVNWLRPLGVDLTAFGEQLRTVRDRVTAPVQPLVPVRVVYTWKPAPGSSLRPGDRVRLGVYERYEVEDSPIEGVLTAPVLVGVVTG